MACKPVPPMSDLLDQLVRDVVDPIRATLYPQFGTRQWDVYLVRRSWSGGQREVGSPLDVSMKIVPAPLIKDTNGLQYEMSPIGRIEEGNIELHQVSLQLTEDQLTGTPIASNENFFYKVVDAHDNNIPPRYYVLAKPPYPDRIKEVGWIIVLKRAELASIDD